MFILFRLYTYVDLRFDMPFIKRILIDSFVLTQYRRVTDDKQQCYSVTLGHNPTVYKMCCLDAVWTLLFYR